MIALVLALSLAQTAEPSAQPLLYTGCGRVAVAVDVEDNEVAEKVADKDALETMLESRLRAARLYEDGTGWRGIARISVTGLPGELVSAFNYRFQFVRYVFVQALDGRDRRGLAPVWTRHSYGYFGETHDPSPGVSAALSDITDEFIRDYLRENEAYCP